MRACFLPAILLCCGAATASLAAGPPAKAQAKAFRDVLACQATTDRDQRLACFDAAVGQLQAAETRRDVVVMDREEVRETRRSLFGLAMPSLKLFGGADEKDDIKRVDSTIARADRDPYGNWLFVLADGARWRQTDQVELGRTPRAGDKVAVMRAALGSFKLSVAGGGAVRVHREN